MLALPLPITTGDDWQLAKSHGTSSLHILNPTGLQLQLKQSVVKKDAYLPRSVHTMYMYKCRCEGRAVQSGLLSSY